MGMYFVCFGFCFGLVSFEIGFGFLGGGRVSTVYNVRSAALTS